MDTLLSYCGDYKNRSLFCAVERIRSEKGWARIVWVECVRWLKLSFSAVTHIKKCCCGRVYCLLCMRKFTHDILTLCLERHRYVKMKCWYIQFRWKWKFDDDVCLIQKKISKFEMFWYVWRYMISWVHPYNIHLKVNNWPRLNNFW